GFWFKKPSAIFANLKAFLVNRVGDFGFLLGIAGVLMWFGTLDYANVFANATGIEGQLVEVWPGVVWSVPTVIAICLFIGAMGKSAQVPLHVWLPDSMEGPTPISALIHAATMVTAGIFMVARMSPLFELSETALSFVLFIGATTAFFTGLIGIVQNDIKRVVAYSTLSQLGYMTVALGVSAYSGAVYHLMTHAFFKALLFLGAGSVIIALHHEQDMRKMGGLRRYMPITWITMWIGTLALTGLPFLSGFYSKDSIIEAAHHAAEHGGWIQQYGYWSVLLGVFVTSFYSFRLLYLTFHGKERFREVATHDAHHGHNHHPVEPKESPWVVTVPLVLLAIPSLLVGFFTAGPMLFGDFFEGSIYVKAAHDTIAAVGEEFHGAAAFALHGMMAPAFWLAFSGFALATYIYLFNPGLAARAREVFSLPYRVLDNKYGFDTLWINGFAAGGLRLGRGLWKGGDQAVIDGAAVNGSAWLVDRIAGLLRHVQSGYLYHYAFAMILGLIFMLAALIRVQG
ncbi:MAG: NADH-quinone oxidoreductase subunit L, partial [Gammaproteobacteria bacterium HGW-Gammaproteobacteria-6]